MKRIEKVSASNSKLAKKVDRLIERIHRLNSNQIDQLDRFITRLEEQESKFQVNSADHENSAGGTDWPHAPLHRLCGKGTFIVTAGTCQKAHYFGDADRLDYLQRELLTKAGEYGWHIEAWAIFSNHYHFVGHAIEDSSSLRQFLAHLHADTARHVNKRDGVVNRQVWFNFWETELTYEKSYLARLNYVHQNAVKHGIVPVANQYRWCSAAWFERTATPSQVKTIYSFKTDRIKVVDEFDVLGVR